LFGGDHPAKNDPMSKSRFLTQLRSRTGAEIWIAERSSGEGLNRICLAHRIDAGAARRIEPLRDGQHPLGAATLGIARLEDATFSLAEIRPAEVLSRIKERYRRTGRAGIPVPVVSHVVADVARFAAFLHARGLSHGALDVDRVALDYEGRVMVCDVALGVLRRQPQRHDVAALGYLMRALNAQLPAPLLDIAQRATRGKMDASEVAVGLMAWHKMSGQGVDDEALRISEWMRTLFSERLAAWNSVAEAPALTPDVVRVLRTLIEPSASRAVPAQTQT